MPWGFLDDKGAHLLLLLGDGDGGGGGGCIVRNDVSLKDTDLVLEKQVVCGLAVADVSKLLGRILPCKLEQNIVSSWVFLQEIRHIQNLFFIFVGRTQKGELTIDDERNRTNRTSYVPCH